MPDEDLAVMKPETVAHLLRHHAHQSADYGQIAAVEMLVGYGDGCLLSDQPQLRRCMRMTAAGAEVGWSEVAGWAATGQRDGSLSPARAAALGFAYSLATGMPGLALTALFGHFDGRNKAVALRACYVAAGGYDMDSDGAWLRTIDDARDTYLAGYGSTRKWAEFAEFINRRPAAQRAVDAAGDRAAAPKEG